MTGKKSALRLKIMSNIHTCEFSKACTDDFEVLLFLLYRNDIVHHCKSTNMDKREYLFQGSPQNCIPPHSTDFDPSCLSKQSQL